MNKKDLASLRKELMDASYTYYNTDHKEMSDDEFDHKKKIYEDASGELLPVGAPPDSKMDSLLSLNHSYDNLAGTLSKATNYEEFVEWLKKVWKPNLTFITSPKADGHSVTVEVNCEETNPFIEKAMTRGQDGVGKDLSNLFKAHSDKFNLQHFNENYGISFEAVMTFRDFDELVSKHNLPYKNPRSIINAIFSEKGKQYFEYMSFIPLKIKGESNSIRKVDATESFNDIINRLGVDDHYFINIEGSNDFDDDCELLWNEFLALQDTRNNDEYPIMLDGMVIEIADHDLRNKMGYHNSRPNYAIAIKFESHEKTTYLRDITWSTEGHSGKHTPMAHFDTVVIDNNDYTKVSLANYERFMSMDLHEGDKLIFTRRNDVLGYVDKVDGSTIKGAKKFMPPLKCNECDSTLIIDGAFLTCVSTDCKLNVVGNIMAALEAFDMKLIGRKTIEKLVDNGVISSVYDLLFLKDKKDEIKSIDGLGSNIIDLSNKMNKKLSENVMDYQILDALHITNLGTARSKDICKFVNLSELQDMSVSEIIGKQIPNVGETISFYISNYFKEHNGHDLFVKLMDYFKNSMTSTYLPPEKRIEQLTFVHTGGAEPFAKRKELISFIESRGHKMSGSVSANTDFLICNEADDATSSKAKNAKKLGIKIVTVQDVVDMLN